MNRNLLGTRLLTMLVMLILCVSIFPATALAADEAPAAPTENYLATMGRGYVVYMIENYNVNADGTSGTPKVSPSEPRAFSFKAEPGTYELSEVYQGEDGSFYVDLTVTDLDYYLEWYLEEYEDSNNKYVLDTKNNGTVSVKLKWNGSQWQYEETAGFNANRGVYVYVVHSKHSSKDAWTVEKEATCTEDGLRTKRCDHLAGGRQTSTRCNYEISEVIKATGHTEEVIPGKAATCTESGLTEGKKCSVCGETMVKQEEIPALGHTEETVPGKAATCTEPGLTEGKKCSVCGETLVDQEEIPATGHSWDDGKVIKEPTCTKQGKMLYTCKNDSTHTKTADIKAEGHTPSGWKCSETHHWKVCTECKKTIENTKEKHMDNNSNLRCDVCGMAMAKRDQNAPGTGDSTPLKVLLVLMLISAAGIAVMLFFRKKVYRR